MYLLSHDLLFDAEIKFRGQHSKHHYYCFLSLAWCTQPDLVTGPWKMKKETFDHDLSQDQAYGRTG